ncbi:MAG: DegV family EDD domain-containing protein [Deltaproteobacteria bacterium]|nr:DegV family EDD domain-containing protein [Deltaproteobacteria bacterium]
MSFEPELSRALSVGAVRVLVWSDVLDRINVFPVADGDTGTNLALTLSILRNEIADTAAVNEALLLAARGNSGNIAARFLSGMLQEASNGLAEAARAGRDLAWKAVSKPVQGTMLDVFDALNSSLDAHGQEPGWIDRAVLDMEAAVLRTRERLSELRLANVVDAGALGMFMFLDGVLKATDRRDDFHPIMEPFGAYLNVSGPKNTAVACSVCIDAVIEVETNGETKDDDSGWRGLGPDTVTFRQDRYRKVHFHADNPDEAMAELRSRGTVIRWKTDDMSKQVEIASEHALHGPVHVMTDAAGSLTREDAVRSGITLLDSYVIIDGTAVPETRVDPFELYAAMREGRKVSTTQASVQERHQHFEKALAMYDRVVYLCVGSAYTGNFDVAMEWKTANDTQDRFVVIDSTAASGRLALIALATARRAVTEHSQEHLAAFAKKAREACEEYIFLDTLRFLAAGGRLSKTSAFLGDALRLKPVVSPLADGAKKVATARNRGEQVNIAFDRMDRCVLDGKDAIILLEHTDNREWIENELKQRVMARYHSAEILVMPMSVTSGAHMGPGTWAVALCRVPPSGDGMP